MSFIREANYDRYHARPATLETASGEAHWITRAANVVLVVTKVIPGSKLSRQGQPDEYMLLLPDDVGATIDAGVEKIQAKPDSLTIIPPGDSNITLDSAGFVYRIFTHKSIDLLRAASNASSYADGAGEVAPLSPWPDPVGGFKLRNYELAKYIKPGTNMRLFRSTNLMVNIFTQSEVPRDVTKMTPHSHDDFEQISLAVKGTYVHHLRYPWTPDMPSWRQDEHGEVGSPSAIVIPAKVIHTTQSISAPNRLVDIFAPPRADFSLKPGLVNNAEEYPLPPELVGHGAQQSAAA